MIRTARTYFDSAGAFVGVMIVFEPDTAARESLHEDGISVVQAGGAVFRQQDPYAGRGFVSLPGAYTSQHRLENGAAVLGPPPPRPIAKRTILERLHAAGKLVSANAVLNGSAADSASLLRAEKWYAAATIMSDDEEAIAFLEAIGADPAAILAPE